MEFMVRMGEAAASATPGDSLVCIGLGSCIGLMLVDLSSGVAAMAHVMLPQAPQAPVAQPHKYADLAVPALLKLAERHGSARPRLQAAMVGGAAMFRFGGAGQEIGARNAAAVAEQLDRLRIPVCASVTGGDRGRTVRVHVGRPLSITVREAGGQDQQLLSGAAGLRPAGARHSHHLEEAVR